MIKLESLQPLFVGQLRRIYQHPADSELLIKVIRPEIMQARWGGFWRWHKRLPRARHYVGYVRELKEYIALQARSPQGDPPIVRMLGIVHTDLGLGLVSEKVRDAAGAPGPTLAVLYQQHGFAPWIEDALGAFMLSLQINNVIVGDMHAWNLVYGSDSRGGPRLVLVDGFGEKNVVPRNSSSRILNQWNNRRLYRRMRRQLIDLVEVNTPTD